MAVTPRNNKSALPTSSTSTPPSGGNGLAHTSATTADIDDPFTSGTPPTPNALSGLLANAVSSQVEREEVKVNNASVTEMKNACDDALKRVSWPFALLILHPFGRFLCRGWYLWVLSGMIVLL